MKACAQDDPRREAHPCGGSHHPKERNYQHASCQTCTKCGLQPSYKAKKGHSGENRRMGPMPHTIKSVTGSLEQTIHPDPDQCKEKMSMAD